MAAIIHFFSHIWLAMDKTTMALLNWSGGPLMSQMGALRKLWVASSICTGFPLRACCGGGEAAGLLQSGHWFQLWSWERLQVLQLKCRLYAVSNLSTPLPAAVLSVTWPRFSANILTFEKFVTILQWAGCFLHSSPFRAADTGKDIISQSF